MPDNILLPDCHNCGRAINENNPYVETNSGEACCRHCTTACQRAGCEKIITRSAVYSVGAEEWCRSCTGSFSLSCSVCGDRQSLSQPDGPPRFVTVGFRDDVCVSCFERHWWGCPCRPDHHISVDSRCMTCFKDRDGYKVRCECGRGTKARPIHDYSCKPTLVFHGKSKEKIHMGFELETQINGGNNNSDIQLAALFAMDALQPLEIAELKNDSSIGGGFEIVTQPHTYEKYRDGSQVLWETIDALRTDYKARSWDAGTCGLHIHIARKAFRDGLHTHRFIEFVYRNPEMLMKFAGRNSARYATFADCWGKDEYEQPKFDIEDKLNRRENTTRGSAVNTLNEHTLELRFFRGTMRPSGVLSALGLAHSMVQYTRTMIPDVNAPRGEVFAWEPFRVWVEERADEYPDLMARMPLIKDVNLKNVPLIEA